MTSKHLSIRIDSTTFERLTAEGRRTNQSRSEVAKTLLEEGLRMEAHPGIVFRGGPAGRRASVGGGPDVWEIVGAMRGLTGSGDELVRLLADTATLSPQAIRAALGYYAAHSVEIDSWIERNDEEAEKAATDWQREQELLRK